MNLHESEPPQRDTIGQMSHDLRTPMTSIMGFAELLLEDESIQGESREHLTIISSEARRLADMLNHYLSILQAEQRMDESSEDSDPN